MSARWARALRRGRRAPAPPGGRIAADRAGTPTGRRPRPRGPGPKDPTGGARHNLGPDAGNGESREDRVGFGEGPRPSTPKKRLRPGHGLARAFGGARIESLDPARLRD